MATCKVIEVGFITRFKGKKDTSYSVPAFTSITAAFTYSFIKTDALYFFNPISA
jgi:hypothetical protein